MIQRVLVFHTPNDTMHDYKTRCHISAGQYFDTGHTEAPDGPPDMVKYITDKSLNDWVFFFKM